MKNKIFWIPLIIIIIAIACGGYLLVQSDWLKELGGKIHLVQNGGEVVKYEEEKPKLLYKSLLDGRDLEKPEEEVWAMMVENSPESRYVQKGLSDASLLIEAIAEGGITRYVAVFSHDFPERIGPVRSARPYFIEWIEGFQPFYFHAGGSDDGLKKIRTDDSILAFDALVYEGKSYFVRDRKIPAPHNLFALSSDLLKIKENAKWEFDLPSKNGDVGWFNFSDQLSDQRILEDATQIDLDFSFPQFEISFSYDASAGDYQRKVGGEIHLDQLNQKAVRPANVIVLVTGMLSTNDEKGHMDYTTVGSGKMWLFRDGKVQEGKWQRKSGQIMEFKDSTGQSFGLKPGQTIIEVLDSSSRLEFN